MNLLLSDKERDRFVAYLENEASSAEGIAAQMEKIGTPDFLVKKIRTEAVAARIIAAKLKATESMTIEQR